MVESIIMDSLEKRSHVQRAKAVIFDFDGTLAVLNIDFSLMRERVFEVMRAFGVKEDSIKERYLLEIIDEVYPILWGKNPSDAKEFYEKAHQILHEIEMNAAREGKLIPGGEETLKTLRRKGMKVGIITRNCEKAVRQVFPEIDDYCDAFISRDFVEKVKPHPDHLNSMLNVLKVAGKDSVMIGDHLIDIQAGKIAGMITVGVLTGRITRNEFEEAGADYILKDVSEIDRLLMEDI
ncbi:MAG: HAD family hydrolase [Deltaproteobacteria bacterium]|nr:HAD family hydrolase [Deltaproteobacteria bacterium]